MDPRDSAAELEQTIERYNEAWNAQDLEAILAVHAPGMVFENHTAGDRVEGDAVGQHIAGIFERNPDLRFTGRRLYARDGLVVSEWTARATNRAGQLVEWDGIDVFPFESGGTG
jgi:ketosteroid isomerase-like protein